MQILTETGLFGADRKVLVKGGAWILGADRWAGKVTRLASQQMWPPADNHRRAEGTGGNIGAKALR